ESQESTFSRVLRIEPTFATVYLTLLSAFSVLLRLWPRTPGAAFHRLGVLAQHREDIGAEVLGELGRVDQALISHQGEEKRARRHAVGRLFLDEAEGLDAEPDLGALPPEGGLGV